MINNISNLYETTNDKNLNEGSKKRTRQTAMNKIISPNLIKNNISNLVPKISIDKNKQISLKNRVHKKYKEQSIKNGGKNLEETSTIKKLDNTQTPVINKMQVETSDCIVIEKVRSKEIVQNPLINREQKNPLNTIISNGLFDPYKDSNMSEIVFLQEPFMHNKCGFNFSKNYIENVFNKNKNPNCPNCKKRTGVDSFIYNPGLKFAITEIKSSNETASNFEKQALEHFRNAYAYLVEKDYKKSIEEIKKGLKINCDDNTKSQFYNLFNSISSFFVDLYKNKKESSQPIELLDQEIFNQLYEEMCHANFDIPNNIIKEFSCVFLDIANEMRGQAKYDGAIKNYIKSINLNKKVCKNLTYNNFEQYNILAANASCYQKIGYAYLEQKKYEESIKNLNKSIKIIPQQIFQDSDLESTKLQVVRLLENSYYYLGIIYRDQKNYQKAIENLDQSIKTNQQYISPELKSINKSEEKSKLLKSYYYLSTIYQDQKNYKEAIENLKKLIKAYQEDPDVKSVQKINFFAQANYLLGKVYQECKDYENANKYINNSIQVFENCDLNQDQRLEVLNILSRAYFDIGNIYLEQKNDKEAITCFNAFIQKSEETLKNFNLKSHPIELLQKLQLAYNKLSSIYLKNNEYKNAIDNFNKLINMQEQVIQSADVSNSIKISEGLLIDYHARGLCYYESRAYQEATKDFEESIKYFNKASDKNLVILIKLAKVYYDLGKALNKQEKHQGTVDKFNESIKSGNNLLLNNNLTSIQRFEVLKILNHVYYKLGSNYMIKKQWQEAEKYFQNSIQMKKNILELDISENLKNNLKDDKTYMNLANIYSEWGKTEDLMQICATILSQTKNTNLRQQVARLILKTTGAV